MAAEWRIYDAGHGLWGAEFDGADMGKARTPSRAASYIETEVAKRLPPYWGLKILDAGEPRQSATLTFASEDIEDQLWGREQSIAELVEYAWSRFVAENEGWAWIRDGQRPESED